MSVHILNGDCREILRTLPDESAHCVVTSPPYFGLRDYGAPGQIGLEETPSAFVAEIVDVFREVRRVLRNEGTLWLNLGDSYAGSWGAQGRQGTLGQMAGRSVAENRQRSKISAAQIKAHPQVISQAGTIREAGLKPKDLMGIPWRVAFALQADGWWLRQDIIWHKPNPMPESTTDRCTKAHEYLFLLTKSERYAFDAAAISEAADCPRGAGNTRPVQPIVGEREGENANLRGSLHSIGPRERRNKRSVWSVATSPFAEAHFATFPPALIVDCIKAGCPADGTVLDPFGGAGTTGLVAQRLGRRALLIEINPEYAVMAERRIAADRASPVEKASIRNAHKPVDHGPLFAAE